MKFYGVGNALLHFREKENISQIQLCEGICSVATLSRIEKGGREFDSLISETLLSRLGKTANRFEFVLNEEDYYLYEIREQIEKNIKERQLEKAQKLLDEYKKKMPKNQILHQQFLTFYKTKLLELKHSFFNEIKQGYYETINMTRPDFKNKSEDMILYSSIEVKTIYQLFLMNDYEKEELYSLFRFMNKYYDTEEKENNMIPFLYHMVERYQKEKRYEEVIKVSQEAIDIICSGRRSLYLPDLYFYKIKAQEKLYGSSREWKYMKAELMEECNSLYYVYMIEEDIEKMHQIEQFCREKLKCRITK